MPLWLCVYMHLVVTRCPQGRLEVGESSDAHSAAVRPTVIFVLLMWGSPALWPWTGACMCVCVGTINRKVRVPLRAYLRDARDGSTVGGIKSSHPRVQALDPTPSPRFQCWRPGPTYKTNLDDPTPFNIELLGGRRAKRFPRGGNLFFRLPTVRFYFVTENIPRAPPNRPATL